MRPKTDWAAVAIVTLLFVLDLLAWVGILAALGLL